MIAGGSIAGPGRLRIDESVGPAAPGTVQVPGAGSLVVGELWIGEPSALDLQTGGTTGQLAMSGAGLRLGSGTLTATNAALTGGVLRGGVTKITGTASINGDAANPTLRGGATLRTQGTTTWSGGAVTLGAPGESGTWENAGTLNADNANTGAGKPDLKLVAGDPSGVLRNLGGATLNRGAPAGVLGGAGRIENAGTVNVSAGTLGEPAPGSSGAYLQTAGTTTVAAGATLSMNATLDGGQLRGNGTVRKVINAKGVVAPGSSPGTLTVSGDYAQGPLGTLAAEVAGPLSAQFDHLIVGGAATVAGTLAISADGGYTPAPQSKHEILTASSLGGTFTTVTGAQTGGSSFVPDYGPSALRLCFAGCTPGELGNKLEVTLSGAGAGTVTSDSGGIACAPDCTRAFAPGATVKLTANAAPGSVFVGWSDPCSGTGTCELTMSSAQAVTASFSIQPQAPAAPESPAAAPAPAKPSTPAKLARLSASGVISMPSSKSCVRKARLSVRVRLPAGLTGRRATAVIRGRQRAAVTGAAMKKPFTVRTPAKGPFTLKVTVTVADGRSVSASARYHAC